MNDKKLHEDFLNAVRKNLEEQPMADRTVELKIDGKASLIKHIEDLQEIIARRNDMIEALTKENEELKKDPQGFLDRLADQNFRRGWNACKNTIKREIQGVERILDREDL